MTIPVTPDDDYCANNKQVVDSILTINPGPISRRRAAGTYAQMAIHPRVVSEEEQEQKNVSHNLYERTRVDIAKI